MEASAIRAPAPSGRFPGAGPLLRLRSDEQLVTLFRKGHDEAFEVIDARYRERLLVYTRRMLGGSRTDAEDATQDVFVRACGALRDDDRPIALRAWLYRIAHNRCIDEIRRPAPAPGDVLDVSRPPQRDPVAEAERREKVRQLVIDIGRLPAQQRSAFLMRWMDGMSYAEIAAALGVSGKAVKSLLVRAHVGIGEAVEARDAPCADIRAELALARHRGVRMTARSSRHIRDCAGCRDFRLALRGLRPEVGGRFTGHGAIAAIAKLLGIGGAGSGATTLGGGAAAGAGTIAVGGPIAAKVAAILCVGAAAAGVAEYKPHPTRVAPEPRQATAQRTAHASPATPTAAVLQRVDRRAPAAAAPARTRGAVPRPVARPTPSILPLHEQSLTIRRSVSAAPIPRSTARRSGGALAPDEPGPRAAPARADTPAKPAKARPAPEPDTPPAHTAPAAADPASQAANATAAADTAPTPPPGAATEPTGGTAAPDAPPPSPPEPVSAPSP